MKKLMFSLQKLIPEGMESLEKRYVILRTIYYRSSIGRRALALEMRLTERSIRSEVEFLKKQDLIQIYPSGMHITDEGLELLESLQDFIYEFRGLHGFEEKLSQMLQIKKVIVVPGNVDEDSYVKKEIGKQAARYFLQILKEPTNIAITGGSTVESFVEMMPKKTKSNDIVVVPARGSVGYEVEYQANILAAALAGKLGGEYKNFNIPDNLSRKSMESILQEKEIQEAVEHMKKAQILICGIGDAMNMAKKRNLPEPIQDFLIRKKAVSEAFGYYFNENGDMVYISRSIGIKLEDVKTIEHIIVVAGGKSKAKSIACAPFLGKNACLIIDEGAAAELEKLFTNSQK